MDWRIRAAMSIEQPLPHNRADGIGELDARLNTVLETLYLMFNEGYAAHDGDQLVRQGFVDEACRLTSMLLTLATTATPTVHALLALMFFHSARLSTRTCSSGHLVLLAEQNRDQWDRGLIRRGFHHLRCSAGDSRLTGYHIEAAIAATHVSARSFEETDWTTLLSLYDRLLQVKPSPIVALNRAVAIAMARGAEAGLAELDAMDGQMRLSRYHLFAASRGEILTRAGRHSEAAEEFRRALALHCTLPERTLLQDRLARAAALAAHSNGCDISE